jgi:hypothetical protein
MEEWKQDIYDGLRRENWSLNGPNRIVKVVPIGWAPTARLHGYVTTEQYLIGKTPNQIRELLGLQPGFLTKGCRVYRISRLPMIGEYEYELTAYYPDGLAFNPADMEEARHEFRQNPSARIIPGYPPGSRFVQQWRLMADLPAVHLVDLLPGQAYRRV